MARRRAIAQHATPAQRATVHESTDTLGAPLVDPRDGDVEADASSTESRSLLAIAGNLLVEVSLPKLVSALLLLLVLPALLLGSAPLLASMWWNKFATTGIGGIGAITVLGILIAVGWFGGRKLFRLAESSFWSMNAMAIQPAYVTCREGLLHLGNRMIGAEATEQKKAQGRA